MTRALRLLYLRQLFRPQLRTLVAVMAVAAGSSLALSVVVVRSSVSWSMAQFGRELAGPAPLRVVGADSSGGLEQRYASIVESTPGVALAVPVVQVSTVVRTAQGRSQSVVALGVDCRGAAFIGRTACETDPLGAASHGAGAGIPGEAAIPMAVSSTLAAELGQGSWLQTATGAVPLSAAAGLSALNGVNGGAVVVTNLDVAQRLFDRVGRLDVVYVVPKASVPTAVLASRLREAVGPQNAVLTAADLPPSVVAALLELVPLLTVLAVLAAAIAAVLVYNVVSLSLEQRRRDHAVAAAVGASPRLLVAGPLVEAAAMGMAGGVLGAFGGGLLAAPTVSAISTFSAHAVGIPVVVHSSPGTYVVGLVLGLGIGVVAAVGPVRRALGSDVVAELSGRQQVGDARRGLSVGRAVALATVAVAAIGVEWLAARHGALAGWQPPVVSIAFVVCVLASVLAVGFWAPVAVAASTRRAPRQGVLRLALANVVRQPGRTGVVAVALAASVGVAFMTASYDLSIHDGIAAGLARSVAGRGVVVTTVADRGQDNGDGRVPAQAAASLAALPGVARVEPFRLALTGATPTDLIGVEATDDLSGHPAVDVGNLTMAAYRQGEVMAGPGLARRLHLGPGSKLALDTPAGRVAVTVEGVWEVGDFNGESVTMSSARFAELFGPQLPTTLELVATPGTNVAALRARAAADGLAPDLVFRTPAGLLAQVSSSATSALAPFWALQRALLVVAFVSVLSTLLLAALQRRREFGLLAAAGLTPGDQFRVIMAEGVIVAAVAAALGIVMGVADMGALVQVTPLLVGYHDPYRLDLGSLALYVPLALVVAACASSWPAWRVARMQVVEALQYE